MNEKLIFIYYLSNNKKENFIIYRYCDQFFLSCSLENGFGQVEKLVEISEELFTFIREKSELFNPYSICLTENTNKLEIINCYNDFFYIYKINSKIFIETIRHDREYFMGERFAVMLNIYEILPIMYDKAR